jgi:hypothetical protein
MQSIKFAGVAALAVAAAATDTRAESAYALLNNDPSLGQQLVTFDTDTRAVTSTVLLQTATPLSPLASIDVRPATGQLYGYDSTARQLFTVEPSNGALTAVGAPLPAGNNGTFIDFNPTVDRIRLIGFDNTNFRVNPDTGAIASTDGNLAYAPGDANAGDTPLIRGVGYTNSFAGATATTLYDIDVSNDVLVRQDPPNDGVLNTVGPLGVDLNAGLFGTFNGFDISGATGTAYLTDGAFSGPSNLYTVNLATGAATSLGAITGLPTNGSTFARTVADIAVVIPEPASLAGLATVGLFARRRRV